MNICKPHCIENQIYVFSEMKLRGLNPNSYIYVAVSDIYIPSFGLPIWLPFWETEYYNSALELMRPRSFISYINRNLTFILDSH